MCVWRGEWVEDGGTTHPHVGTVGKKDSEKKGKHQGLAWKGEGGGRGGRAAPPVKEKKKKTNSSSSRGRERAAQGGTRAPSMTVNDDRQ